MRTSMIAAALICLGAPAVAHAVAAAPVHEYRFDGNLHDTLGGPDLQSLGGTVDAGSYTFAAGQGLILDNALTDGASYTVEITARLDQVSGFRRILDFKDGASDDGLYSFAATLSLPPVIFGSDTVFSTDAFTTILISRDGATNTFSAYANGVSQFTITDVADVARFSTPAGRMVFFRDDTVFPGENTSGIVTSIRVFDRGLAPAEVAQLYAPVPEPGTWALTLAGLAVLGWGARRRRSRQVPSH